ncbi:MAG TPA: tetratricopeptide repeat protein [Bacteroidia bacterium]|nr:tetratricopeptide repeat protein [Bacteroidia bacterium]
MKKTSLFLFLIVVSYSQAQQSTVLRSVFSKSYAYETSKQYSKAAMELKSVSTENTYELNLRIGWLYYEAGEYNESITYYQKAIQLAPNSVEAKLGLVYPLSVQNKWDEVLTQYLAILSVDPKNALVNYRTGLIYYNRKNYSTAKKYLETVLELYPFDYDSNLLMGWTKLALSDKAGALSSFEKVLLYKPSDASALEGEGLCK